jgi:hypothetical protein
MLGTGLRWGTRNFSLEDLQPEIIARTAHAYEPNKQGLPRVSVTFLEKLFDVEELCDIKDPGVRLLSFYARPKILAHRNRLLFKMTE